MMEYRGQLETRYRVAAPTGRITIFRVGEWIPRVRRTRGSEGESGWYFVGFPCG